MKTQIKIENANKKRQNGSKKQNGNKKTKRKYLASAWVQGFRLFWRVRYS